MADITALILADHEWFREQFARLDDLQACQAISRTELDRLWRPLADRSDVHAYIEEKIFYPHCSSGAPTTQKAKRSTRSATTWARRNVKGSRTFVDMHRSGFVKRSEISTASSWRNIPRCGG